MSRLFLLASATLLGGCVSQIFLDGSPPDAANIAGGTIERQVYAMSSDACGRRQPGLPYQLAQRGREGWVWTCAAVEGFAFRAGNDYFLRIVEHRDKDDSSSVRLILKNVIEERPHARN